jgi:hypothetical protein
MGWVVSATPWPLYPWKETRYTFYRRLDESQDRYGRVRKISPPPGLFCSLCLYFFSIFLCPDCFGFCLLSLLYNTHDTNIHASVGGGGGGVQTRNSSRRSASDPRLRLRGHWDRQGFDLWTVMSIASRSTDYAVPFKEWHIWFHCVVSCRKQPLFRRHLHFPQHCFFLAETRR